MDNQQMPPVSQPANMPVEHKKVGPIIFSLIVVLVLVVAALYIFAAKLSQDNTNTSADTITNNPATATSGTSASLETIKPVTNTSDDTQSINDDLNTSINGIDSQNF